MIVRDFFFPFSADCFCFSFTTEIVAIIVARTEARRDGSQWIAFDRHWSTHSTDNFRPKMARNNCSNSSTVQLCACCGPLKRSLFSFISRFVFSMPTTRMKATSHARNSANSSVDVEPLMRTELCLSWTVDKSDYEALQFQLYLDSHFSNFVIVWRDIFMFHMYEQPRKSSFSSVEGSWIHHNLWTNKTLRLLTILEFQEAFNLFDNRGDGKIQQHQIGECLRALGQNPTESDVKKFTHQLKPDERISFEVFLPIYQVRSRCACDRPCS